MSSGIERQDIIWVGVEGVVNIVRKHLKKCAILFDCCGSFQQPGGRWGGGWRGGMHGGCPPRHVSIMGASYQQ